MKIKQSFSQSWATYTLMASCLGFTACGGTGQDDGNPSSVSDVYAGVVVDGYLARATVYLDTNNNAYRDAWEPFAFTDNDGYYSYNPLTNVNYCAEDATSAQQQFCLRTSTEHSDVVVRVQGGYDLLTGEPFTGQMSRRVDGPNGSHNAAPTLDNVVSPITTLLTNADRNDHTTVLNAMGLNAGDEDVDYFNSDGNGAIDAALLNVATKVHRVVSALSDRLTDTYTEIGENVGMPNDASSLVYRELTSQMLSSGQSFNNTLDDTSAIAAIMDRAEERLRESYTRKELDLPSDLGSSSNPTQFEQVIQHSRRVARVVDRLLPPTPTPVPEGGPDMGEYVAAQTRILESLTIKVLNENGGNDSSIETAANFITNPDNNALVDALVDSMRSNASDLTTLATHSFSGSDFESEESIRSVAQLAEDALPFMQVGGLALRVSDLDLGQGPDQLDDSEVEWYFHGDANDVEGAFSACVKHIDDANVDGTLGEGSTRGELVDGYWSLLGASSENMESYSLLITLTFLGTTYQAILKPAGTEVVNNVSYQKIRFDNDGEIRAWHSANGFTTIAEDAIPQNNAGCQARLPSRIGV